MRDWDAAYEIRRDMDLDRRLDAGLPTRGVTASMATLSRVDNEQESP